MHLEFESGEHIDNPSPEQMTEAVHRVDGGKNSFLILQSNNEKEFMQISSDGAGYDLEYTDAQKNLHFRYGNEQLTANEVAELMRRFADNDRSLRDDTAWNVLEHKKSGCLPKAARMLILPIVPWLAT